MATPQPALPRGPLELYPKLLDLSWYQSLPAFEPFNVLTLKSAKDVRDHSGGIAVMARVILEVEYKDPTPEQSKMGRFQIRCLAKALAGSPAVIMSSREVPVYQQIVQPLSDDFSNRDDFLALLPPRYFDKVNVPINVGLDNINGAPAPTNSTLAEALLSQPQFRAPRLYHGEIKADTNGKLLLVAEIQQHACHTGVFFGDIPHNINCNLPRDTAMWPGVTSVDVTYKGFSAIARLHAKYFNKIPEIPNFLPGYNMYIKSDEAAEKEYDDYVEFGRKYYYDNIEKREAMGCVVSDYFKSIVEAMFKKSTFQAFQAQHYLPYQDNDEEEGAEDGFAVVNQKKPRKSPVSLIHCDYYPTNAMVTSLKSADGLLDPNAIVPEAANPQDMKLYVIDFEFLCVGNPAQDLAHWAISQIDQNLLKENETKLLQFYYKQLEMNYIAYENQRRRKEAEARGENYINEDIDFQTLWPYEQFLADYVAGLHRWMWVLMTVTRPSKFVTKEMFQFYVNQLEQFMLNHGVTPENCPMFCR